MLGDAYSLANHYDIPFAEAIVTGVAAGLLPLAGSYLFEDRARRIRAVVGEDFRIAGMRGTLGARSAWIGPRATRTRGDADADDGEDG